uniref:Uncharacterized protein At2g11480 n=1 Tax=Arabidopsis thaliana TaxID=3702 RepID=Q9SIG5_ARATH|nr:hypothetical protein [Arabidopsis thaliana]
MDVFHTPLESHDCYKDDAKEGNPIFDTGVKDPNGNDADDEGKIQDTLETVEASLSVLETQPEENIDDDPMREETLETVEASHSMLETQPEENIDDDPMMKLFGYFNIQDNMETAAASHSLLETQREVNIDGDPIRYAVTTSNISYIYSNQLHVYFNIQVIVEILAASHSVSEAQPEVKIGNDATGDTMETPPTSHSLLGFAMFSEKKVTVDMAAAIHSGVCEVNSDPMKAMVVFGSLYLIQVPKLTKSPNHLSHIVPIVWVQETSEHVTKCGFLISNSFLVDLAKPHKWVSTLFTSHLQAKFRAFNAAKMKSRVRWYCTLECSQNHGLQPFLWRRIDGIYKNLRSGDCGPVAMKFLEIQASDKLPDKMAEITDKHVDAFRR